MKSYACLPVCLLLALTVVLTRSPSTSAFSIHPGSSRNYVGSSGAPRPRAGLLHEVWRKPFASTFWRRRRRGSTSQSPGSSGAEMSSLSPPWGFGADDDEGSDEAKRRKMNKLERFTAKLSRVLSPNDVLGFGTPSKFHMRDPFEEAAASTYFGKGFGKLSSIKNKPQSWMWRKASGLQDVSHGSETSSTNEDWSNYDKGSDERSDFGVEDFDDMATKIREAIDILAESERAKEKEEEEEEDYGAHAELPAGPVPPITLFPSPERIPARPVQNGKSARRQEEESEQGEQATLLRTDEADSNGPLTVVNKAALAPSKPSAAESLGLGTWMAPSKTSFPDQTDAGFGSLFMADPKSSIGKGQDLFSNFDFGSSLGGKFDDDDSGCADIETKSCFSDAECSCNGFYHCQQGQCALRSQTPSSDLWGGAGDFQDLGLVWLDRPAEISRIKRRQPTHPAAAAAAAARATAAATKSTKAGKENVAMDRSDSQLAVQNSLTKRRAQAGSDVQAVQAARSPAAPAHVTGVEQRALVGDAARLPAPAVSKSPHAQ